MRNVIEDWISNFDWNLTIFLISLFFYFWIGTGGAVVVAQFTGGDMDRQFEIDFWCDNTAGLVINKRKLRTTKSPNKTNDLRKQKKKHEMW